MILKINRKTIIIFTAVTISICGLISILNFYNRNNKIKSASSSYNNKIVFIIDAGHGGEDGGTNAKDGTLEKDINLNISKKLEELLTFSGYDVIMTREKDSLIYDSKAKTMRQKKVSDIRNRMKIIENNPNAILISIHQNHFENPIYKGTQVFYSKNNPKSKLLAEDIQRFVVSNIQKDNKRAVKKTGTEIYLLYHAKIPAVMVECGFLSNIEEANKLKNDEYQQKMAFSIFCGILNYIENSNAQKGDNIDGK